MYSSREKSIAPLHDYMNWAIRVELYFVGRFLSSSCRDVTTKFTGNYWGKSTSSRHKENVQGVLSSKTFGTRLEEEIKKLLICAIISLLYQTSEQYFDSVLCRRIAKGQVFKHVLPTEANFFQGGWISHDPEPMLG